MCPFFICSKSNAANFVIFVGDNHCVGKHAGQTGRAESWFQHGSELGQEWEGAALGGVGGGSTHADWTVCLSGQQDDPAAEQVHVPPQSQQEQGQRLDGQLNVPSLSSSGRIFLIFYERSWWEELDDWLEREKKQHIFFSLNFQSLLTMSKGQGIELLMHNSSVSCSGELLRCDSPLNVFGRERHSSILTGFQGWFSES